MFKTQILRSLVTERLAAAAEEIFVLFERTLTEYEGEIDRQRKLLHVLTPGMRTESLPTEVLFCEEEVVCEQQERSPSLDQEESQPPQIKEEQEELWSSQEGEQLQGLEEAEVKWTSTPVPVKRERDEEEPQCSWFNQSQPEDSREAQPLPRTSSGHMDTQPDGDHWATAPQPARTSHPAGGSQPTEDIRRLVSNRHGTEAEVISDRQESQQPHSGVQTPRSHHGQHHSRVKGQTLSPSNRLSRSIESSYDLKSFQILSPACCKVCGVYFPSTVSLNRHVKVHSSGCGLCGKGLEPPESLKRHLEAHRICTVCGKGLPKNIDIVTHMRSHSGEKPFICGNCGKGFQWKTHLQTHMRSHTGEKPFSCSVCGKAFSKKHNLKSHMRTHTGEKPFRCPVCGRSFCVTSNLKTHIRTHSNERPFSCSVCGKGFSQSGNFKRHMRTHR